MRFRSRVGRDDDLAWVLTRAVWACARLRSGRWRLVASGRSYRHAQALGGDAVGSRLVRCQAGVEALPASVEVTVDQRPRDRSRRLMLARRRCTTIAGWSSGSAPQVRSVNPPARAQRRPACTLARIGDLGGRLMPNDVRGARGHGRMRVAAGIARSRSVDLNTPRRRRWLRLRTLGQGLGPGRGVACAGRASARHRFAARGATSRTAPPATRRARRSGAQLRSPASAGRRGQRPARYCDVASGRSQRAQIAT